MAIKLKSNSAYDGQVQETNTAARQYYLPNNDSGLGTQLMTAQASTSGTSIDFTSIPSWVKRISILFNEVSTSGTSPVLIQIGSGSVTTTGYVSTSNSLNQANSTAGTSSTAGFVMNSNDATFVRSGSMSLHVLGSNAWVSSHTIKLNTTQVALGGGSVSLGGTLDRVRITTVNGTDTFDAGSINVMYE